MNSFWLVLENEISHETCDAYIDLFNANDSETARHGDDLEDFTVRESEVYGIPFGTTENLMTTKLFNDLVIQCNAECFGFNLNGLQEFQVAKYETDDHYVWHSDMRLNKRESMRKLSITVQLSDPNDYEGGDFEFPEDIGCPARPFIAEKGTVIIFPSFLPHRVTPVTKGTRYSLVGWYEGNNWR